MPDPVPHDSLTLPEAFDRFHLAKYGGNDPVSDLASSRFLDHLRGRDHRRHLIARQKVLEIDRRLMGLAFSLGHLTANYLAPSGLSRVTLGEWPNCPFPEWFFRPGGEDVPEHFRDWHHLTGRTLFVGRTDLDAWIAANLASRDATNKPRLLLGGILQDLIADDRLDPEIARQLADDWLLPDLGACAPLRTFSDARLAAETNADNWLTLLSEPDGTALRMIQNANGATETDPALGPESSERTKSRRGPKARYDWSQFYDHMASLFEHNGYLSPDDPDWHRQSQVETAMVEWCEKSWGVSPGESTIRTKVSAAIDGRCFKRPA